MNTNKSYCAMQITTSSSKKENEVESKIHIVYSIVNPVCCYAVIILQLKSNSGSSTHWELATALSIYVCYRA